MKNRPAYLDKLERDLSAYREYIREAADTVIRDGVSEYPVFIFYPSEFPLGEKILDKDDFKASWSVNVTTAEDLILKGIIQMEKARLFITNYKSPKEYMCLFVINSPEEAGFIYVPY